MVPNSLAGYSPIQLVNHDLDLDLESLDMGSLYADRMVLQVQKVFAIQGSLMFVATSS